MEATSCYHYLSDPNQDHKIYDQRRPAATQKPRDRQSKTADLLTLLSTKADFRNSVGRRILGGTESWRGGSNY